MSSLLFDKLNYVFYSSGFTECYWNSYSESLFDKLVVCIAGAVLTHPHFYSNIEQIFLENILNENTWAALLSVDTWCLILR